MTQGSEAGSIYDHLKQLEIYLIKQAQDPDAPPLGNVEGIIIVPKWLVDRPDYEVLLASLLFGKGQIIAREADNGPD